MKKSAEEILSLMIRLLTTYLQELEHVHDEPNCQFAYGEKTAYVECLEIILLWQSEEPKKIPNTLKSLLSL